jgi:DNA replication and repair protein RecF
MKKDPIMQINKVEFTNFRNYPNKAFEFSEGTIIIAGSNGVGKTNILESVAVLSTGKSPRASLEQELINLNSQFARIIGYTNENDKLEIIIARKPESRRVQKTYKINNAQKTSTDFVGRIKSVMFAPEDIRLVAGSPSRRRDYLDRILSQVHRDYRVNLSKYTRVLKQRNKFLESIRGQILKDLHQAQFDIWNSQLLSAGEIIQQYRDKFFAFADIRLEQISGQLYKDAFLSLNYLKSELNEGRLNGIRQREVFYGTTQIGPHRDDYDFIMNNHQHFDLKGYGSRGQQRTGVLALKILEIQYIQEASKENPILLLDDIFSELDEEYRAAIASILDGRQTLITTADINSVPENIKENANIINL